MEKDITLKIVGTQVADDGTKDSQTTIQKGKYYKKNEKGYVFIEDEITSENSRYVFNHRSIEILRNGDIGGKLIFETGREHKANYRTPYGRMDLIFKTGQYTLTETADNICIEIAYCIYNQNALLSENHTMIIIE